MIAGLVAWRVRPDSKTGALILLIGCLYPWNPLSFLAGSLGQWLFLMFGSVSTGAPAARRADVPEQPL